jgi:hypothetical protein
LGAYIGGLQKFVPGPEYVQFQVGLLGLVLIITIVSLTYLNGMQNVR